MNNKPDFLFVTCANGSEELLAEECIRILGADQGVVAGRGGVMVNETVENAMRLNLRSRLAQRVLWPMVDGDYRDEHDLYELGRRINAADRCVATSLTHQLPWFRHRPDGHARARML